MLRIVYQLLLIVAYPFVRLRLVWRARREPEYAQRVEERFGYVGADLPRGAVWFHTVSAGETIAAVPLIRTLAEEFADLAFLVTTMTPTGSAQVREHLADRVAHCYAPYDFRREVERFFNRMRPRLLVLMETELWPNLIDAAHARGVPVIVINARLSARSARGYARIGTLTRNMLDKLSFIACQYPDHAQRFLELGANPDKVSVLGSVKFDAVLPADFSEQVERLHRRLALGDRPVWVAGSTHPGEEEVVIAAHARLLVTHSQACLLLVPRHPARADAVEALVKSAGLSMVRQSALTDSVSADVAVVLCDSMGQLQYLYGLSQVAFIGGSLVAVGGHNPIEAALCAQPLVVGTETFNFPDVVAAFADVGCLFVVVDAEALADCLRRFFADAVECERLGAAARQVVSENRGASARLLDLLRAEIRARRDVSSA